MNKIIDVSELIKVLHNVGYDGLSEDECIEQGIDFASFEKGCNESHEIIGNRLRILIGKAPEVGNEVIYVEHSFDDYGNLKEKSDVIDEYLPVGTKLYTTPQPDKVTELEDKILYWKNVAEKFSKGENEALDKVVKLEVENKILSETLINLQQQQTNGLANFWCRKYEEKIQEIENLHLSINNILDKARKDIQKLMLVTTEAIYSNERNKQDLLPQVEELQTKIDELMLEYCPEEMTKEQLENYELNQKLVKDTK